MSKSSTCTSWLRVVETARGHKVFFFGMQSGDDLRGLFETRLGRKKEGFFKEETEGGKGQFRGTGFEGHEGSFSEDRPTVYTRSSLGVRTQDGEDSFSEERSRGTEGSFPGS